MNKKTIIILLVSFVLIIGIILIAVYNKKQNSSDVDLSNYVNGVNPEIQVDKSQVSYQENATVDELKQDLGITGDSNLYQIQTEFDGRKVLVIDPNIKYQIMAKGIIEQGEPKLESLTKNIQKEKGVWISENSRDEFLKLLKDNTNSSYEISSEGYLNVKEKNKQSQLDERIEKLINGEKSYIISTEGKCYTIDDVTGVIQSYEFEKLDPYQVYEYAENNGNYAVVLTQNIQNKLTNTEILNSFLDLIS